MKSLSLAVLALVNNASAIKIAESWTPADSRALFEKQVAEAAQVVATEHSIENRRTAATALLNANDIRETFNEKARVTAGQIHQQRGGPATQYGGGHYPGPPASLMQKEAGPWNPAESRRVFDEHVKTAAAVVAEENRIEAERTAANALLNANDIRETFNEKARVTAGQIHQQRGGPASQYGGGHWHKVKTASLAQGEDKPAPWNPAESRRVFDAHVKTAAAVVAQENKIEAERTAANALLNANDIRETFNEKARVRAGQIAMQRGGPPSQYGGGHWIAPKASLAQGDDEKAPSPWNPAASRKVFDKHVATAAAVVAEEHRIEAERTAATALLNENDIRETFNEKARVRAGQIAMQRGGPSTQYWNAPPPTKKAGSLMQLQDPNKDIGNKEVRPDVYEVVKRNVDPVPLWRSDKPPKDSYEPYVGVQKLSQDEPKPYVDPTPKYYYQPAHVKAEGYGNGTYTFVRDAVDVFANPRDGKFLTGYAQQEEQPETPQKIGRLGNKEGTSDFVTEIVKENVSPDADRRQDSPDSKNSLTGYAQQDPEVVGLRVGDLGNTGNHSDSVTSFVKDHVDPVSSSRQTVFPAAQVNGWLYQNHH